MMTTIQKEARDMLLAEDMTHWTDAHAQACVLALEAERDALQTAVKAVIAKWDRPLATELLGTGVYMNAMRKALEAEQAQPVTKAQQVAVPALKIKPFTQRLRDNREADYSLDALMPPTRKEIESAMNEEILELRDALAKAQQVAVPMSDDEMWSLWNHQGIDEMTQPQAIEFARAIEAHHGITPQGDKT